MTVVAAATTKPVAVSNRIGGELRTSSRAFTIHDPADTRRAVSAAPDSDPADVSAAVEAAVAAFPSWARTPANKRADLLERAAAIVARDAEDIARQMVAEVGKPLSDARNEVMRTAANLRLYAGEALRLQGTTFPSDDWSTLIATAIDPVGVVGVITPWNFPLSLASRKIGPALAAGNTVVFKPSSMSPLMGDRLAGAIEEAGFPPGTINVVHGFGAGALTVADERVAAITFTGSTAVGRKIHAALGLGRRSQLELGGNNPVVVLDDADPVAAAALVTRSSFAMSGQACTAAGRVIVQAGIYDDVLDLCVKSASRLAVGSGMADGIDMGPLIDERAVTTMAAAVAEAADAGARIATGGSRLTGDLYDHGWFFAPTILADVEPDMTVASTEVFGPVIGFEKVADLDEALERANANEYGLTAAICTRDLAAAHRFGREIKAGVVRINKPTVGTVLNAPFGGIKASGTGMHKEKLGPTVMDFNTQMRTVYFGS